MRERTTVVMFAAPRRRPEPMPEPGASSRRSYQPWEKNARASWASDVRQQISASIRRRLGAQSMDGSAAGGTRYARQARERGSDTVTRDWTQHDEAPM